MNDKEKKKWIIRYAKKNKIDDILAEKYKNEKESALKKYSNEIQSVCSIISVLVIGVITIILSVQYNHLVKQQTQIMKNEQKPIIDITNEGGINYTDRLLITNNGIDAKSYDVEIFPFIDVMCNENGLGSIPIRVYFINGAEILLNKNVDEVAEITVYKEEYPVICSLKDDLHKIISEYTTLYWDFSFSYLIKITNIDIMDEENIDYFVYNRRGVKRIGNEYGNNLIDEYSYMIDNHDGTKTSKESYFDLEKIDAEQIFRYILNKLRDNNLYKIDFRTNEKYLYGDYEPLQK